MSIDGEYRDFSDEIFRYERINQKWCFTWFTPNDRDIHSKRRSQIHKDDLGNEYVHRYNRRYYLEIRKK